MTDIPFNYSRRCEYCVGAMSRIGKRSRKCHCAWSCSVGPLTVVRRRFLPAFSDSRPNWLHRRIVRRTFKGTWCARLSLPGATSLHGAADNDSISIVSSGCLQIPDQVHWIYYYPGSFVGRLCPDRPLFLRNRGIGPVPRDPMVCRASSAALLPCFGIAWPSTYLPYLYRTTDESELLAQDR